jgi:hypothetical protein
MPADIKIERAVSISRCNMGRIGIESITAVRLRMLKCRSYFANQSMVPLGMQTNPAELPEDSGFDLIAPR